MEETQSDVDVGKGQRAALPSSGSPPFQTYMCYSTQKPPNTFLLNFCGGFTTCKIDSLNLLSLVINSFSSTPST